MTGAEPLRAVRPEAERLSGYSSFDSLNGIVLAAYAEKA
jgi:hypothetical protein